MLDFVLRTHTNGKGADALKKLLLSFFVCLLFTGPAITETQAGPDVNSQEQDGNSPLMFAARYYSDPRVIAALVNGQCRGKYQCGK